MSEMSEEDKAALRLGRALLGIKPEAAQAKARAEALRRAQASNYERLHKQKNWQR